MSSLFMQLLEAQRRFQLQLLAKSGVVGVGLGYKDAHGATTDELCLVALVEQKKPPTALQQDEMIPPNMDGMKTDVIEVGKLMAQNTSSRDRWRPTIPAGVSIGHFKVTAGTYGALVRDKTTGDLFIMSNNHVLANSNDALTGDPILQPAMLDGGQNPADIVARLERFKTLRYVGDPVPVTPPPPTTPTQPTTPTTPTTPPTSGGSGTPPTTSDASGCAALISAFAALLGQANTPKTASSAQTVAPAASPAIMAQAAIAENLFDCALARPTNPSMFTNQIRNLGSPLGTKMPQLGMRVTKSGRTTDTTQGMITLVNATVDVGYSTAAGPKTARFVGQVMASGMSSGGDSGSLILEQNTRMAVGLLFAGSGAATIFTPLDRVLNEMNVILEVERAFG
jgi:hypothetical protein